MESPILNAKNSVSEQDTQKPAYLKGAAGFLVPMKNKYTYIS